MSASHTPGPWIFNGWDIISPSEPGYAGYIANLSNRGKSNWEVDANARLIAAAPDLLAALEELLLIYFGDGESYSYSTARASIDRARAAIVKARGTAP